MTRPIEFRAQRADTGEFVYGDLVKNGWRCFIIEHFSISKGKIVSSIQHEVLPETVGQFTGLLDRNGKKIFEGDIVSAWSEGYNHKGEVRWRMEGQPAIIIYPAFANQGFWKLHADNQGVDDGVEVIGTIHDKPETPKTK